MKKKRHLRIDRLILLILISILLISCIVLAISMLVPKKQTDITVEKTSSETIQQIGTNASSIEMNEDYAYYINYPKFEKPAVDQAIQQFIDSKIQQLKEYAEELKQVKHNNNNTNKPQTIDYDGAVLYIDFNSYSSFKDISSVVFHYAYSIPYANTNEKGVVSLNFNLNQDQLLNFDNVFKKEARNIFAEKVVEQVGQENLLVDNIADKMQQFSFYDNQTKLYFSPYEIAAGSLGTIEVTLPIDFASNYFIQNQTKNTETMQKEEKKPTPITSTNFPIDTTKPMVALTFDDGPSNATTNRILDILEKYQVNASFYMLGINVVGNEDTIIRSYKMGNEMGNHSYAHKSLPTLSNEDLYYEITETNRLLEQVIGTKPKSFRPPYGSYNGVVSAIEMPVVLWDVDTEDWRSRDKDAIINEVKQQVKDGSIILMHDIYQSTADATEVIVPWLIEQGYQIVSVEQLMKAKNIDYSKDKLYFSANNIQ